MRPFCSTPWLNASDPNHADVVHINTCGVEFQPLASFSITSPVLPPGPPSLLPFSTIKLLFPQLAIDLVVSLTHPSP